MKNRWNQWLLTLAIVAISVAPLKAQPNQFSQAFFNKGDVAILGNANMGLGNRSFLFNFRPGIGFMIQNHVMVGFGIGYRYVSNRYQYKENNLSTRLFARYYWPLGASQRISIFVEGLAEVGGGRSRFTDPITNRHQYTNHNFYELNLSPGINIPLSRNFAIECQMGILNYYHTRIGNITDKGLHYDISLSSSRIGFIYRFRK